MDQQPNQNPSEPPVTPNNTTIENTAIKIPRKTYSACKNVKAPFCINTLVLFITSYEFSLFLVRD